MLSEKSNVYIALPSLSSKNTLTWRPKMYIYYTPYSVVNQEERKTSCRSKKLSWKHINLIVEKECLYIYIRVRKT